MAPTPMQLLAVGLLLVGFAFKVSAVPFHMWTPDAYEGAPPAVTGFMSTGVKAAAFAAFVRVFLSAFEPLQRRVERGALGDRRGDDDRRDGGRAWRRSNVKRMLAYSSIAHGGYLLVALVVGQRRRQGRDAVLPARPTPSPTSAPSASSRCSRTRDRPNDRVRDYAGLWNDAPGAGRADDDVPAVARRLPAARRLHREVVRLQRRREGRATPGWRSSAC